MSLRRSSRIATPSASASGPVQPPAPVASTANAASVALPPALPLPLPPPAPDPPLALPALLPTPASLTSLPFELKLAIAHLVRASDIVAKAREEELDDECIGNYEVVEAMPRSIIATNEWGQGLKMLCMTSRAWNAACSQVRVEAITSRHFCEESGHQRILRQYGAFARKITFLGLETRPDHFNKLEHADALEIHEYMEREVGNLPEMLAFLPNVISVSLRHHLVETLYKAMESETAGTASDEDKARIAALRSVLERAEDVKVSLSQHSPTLQIGALLLILRRCRRAHFHGESSPFQEYNKLAWLGMQRIRSNLKHLTFEIEESDPEPVDVKWIEWAREHDDWALESLVIKVAYSSYGEPSRWFLTSNTVDFIAATSSSLEALTIVAPAGVDSNARFTAAYPRLRKLSLTCPLDMAEAFTSSLHASPLAVLELASSDLELPRSILTALPSLTHVTAHTATLAAENEMRKRGIVYVETKVRKLSNVGHSIGTLPYLLSTAEDTIERLSGLLERHRQFRDASGAGMLVRSLHGVEEYLRMDKE